MTSDIQAEILQWQKCWTLKGAGELTALWLEGKMKFHPMYDADSAEDETTPLIEDLAAFNRLGFFTESSQPGTPLENGAGQRAYVSGQCSDSTAAVIKHVLLPTPLVVMAMMPGEPSSAEVCVTIDDGKKFTTLGASTGSAEFSGFAPETVDPRLFAELDNSWTLHIFDPVWGRNDLLWPLVKGALDAAAEVGA